MHRTHRTAAARCSMSQLREEVPGRRSSAASSAKLRTRQEAGKRRPGATAPPYTALPFHRPVRKRSAAATVTPRYATGTAAKAP